MVSRDVGGGIAAKITSVGLSIGQCPTSPVGMDGIHELYGNSIDKPEQLH